MSVVGYQAAEIPALARRRMSRPKRYSDEPITSDRRCAAPTVFTKNRERLVQYDSVIEFFNEVLAIAQEKSWLCGEHFSVDGTPIQAWAGHKSFVRREQGFGRAKTVGGMRTQVSK